MESITQSTGRLAFSDAGVAGKEQYELGLKCEKDQNIEKAIECYKTSYQQKHPDALFRLAYIAITRGNVEARDFFHDSTKYCHLKEGMTSYFKPMADQGNSEAMCCVGLLLSISDIQEDQEKAVNYLTQSAEQGNAIAQLHLGVAYNGGGVSIDTPRAFKYFQKSAAQGNAQAMCWMGLFLLHSGTQADQQEAVKYLEQSAAQENATAQFELGKLYLDGEGVPVNVAVALRYFQQSAENGNPDAQPFFKIEFRQ